MALNTAQPSTYMPLRQEKQSKKLLESNIKEKARFFTSNNNCLKGIKHEPDAGGIELFLSSSIENIAKDWL